ncbi:3-isopropylmalate dehydratase small subunit [Acuticoccus sediminis]|uniref:3-isopropylmalate dehydratase small subunit n=1 Tax=Acuticoccus sediminis TaxID=2184697 RepID=A0A8B2NRK4_9HYPH|nr:3-isopropylmalate dehydratase small subunit [Acuticoccus sediminis]RAH97760.1 3-isopropylmalate dehydratase small subunit [Acuticoccus sediminis]
MQPFVRHTGRAAALPSANVDTDQIVPARYLHRPRAAGYADTLFRDLRDKGGFVLDAPGNEGATVLIAGDNFGCGSSREHAVWAVSDGGYRVVIAPSFGDIFYNNAMKNGLMTVRLPAETVAELMEVAPTEITVDLEAGTVVWGNHSVPFEIEPHHRDALLEGLSEVQMTLRELPSITDFEGEHLEAMPWLTPGKG